MKEGGLSGAVIGAQGKKAKGQRGESEYHGGKGQGRSEGGRSRGQRWGLERGGDGRTEERTNSGCKGGFVKGG